jgi:hypothetical protein
MAAPARGTSIAGRGAARSRSCRCKHPAGARQRRPSRSSSADRHRSTPCFCPTDLRVERRVHCQALRLETGAHGVVVARDGRHFCHPCSALLGAAKRQAAGPGASARFHSGIQIDGVTVAMRCDRRTQGSRSVAAHGPEGAFVWAWSNDLREGEIVTDRRHACHRKSTHHAGKQDAAGCTSKRCDY